MFDSVDVLPSLFETSETDGRLNAYNAIRHAQASAGEIAMVSIGDVAQLEGDALTTTTLSFPVMREGTVEPATVHWEIADGTATVADGDYTIESTAGELTFSGSDTEYIHVMVQGDSHDESHETLFVNLVGVDSEFGDAFIGDAQGVGTILNDDTTVHISDAQVTEGDERIGFLDVFVSSESDRLERPYGLTFGPDGNGDGHEDLYVASSSTNSVLRYDGRTGAYVDAFVEADAGGLRGPHTAIFGPDGELYVSSGDSDRVLRYDGATGEFIDEFVPAGVSPLESPRGMVFGPDNTLYVSSSGTSQVLNYRADGEYVGVSASGNGLDFPTGVTFGPDLDENGRPDLFVNSRYTDQVLRYDATNGEYLGEFVARVAADLHCHMTSSLTRKTHNST